MKLISWNVNGLRAAMGKGFLASVTALDPDVVCLQETKLQAGQLDFQLPGYRQYWNYAEKKGYSGTAIFSRRPTSEVRYGIGAACYDHEGRVITLDMGDFYLVTVYTPNAQRELTRLDFRMGWEDAFRAYVKELEKSKPVVICGDLNVARNDIDLKNPASNRDNAGFTPQEREKIAKLLDAGFIDTFRYFHPDETGAYTWWSYMFRARENNAGWRIDYFLASKMLAPRLVSASIHAGIMGSDHCPVELVLAD